MKTRIYNCYTTAEDDDNFIKQLDEIAQSEGDSAYQAAFITLVDLNLEIAEAKQRWRAVLHHRALLSEVLSRNFGLFPALCDYLSHQSSYIKHPKLTEISVHNRITENANKDLLTGLLNKNSFLSILNQQIELAEVEKTDLSLLFADIDDFKFINDNFGHGAGDNALQKTGELIQSIKRKSDIAFRYGGEEFVIIMSGTKSVDALLLVNRLRESIHQQKLDFNNQKIRISVSCGVASFPANAKNGEELVRFADNAMYQAKAAGKNMVCLFGQDNRQYLRIPLSQNIQIETLESNSSYVHDAISKNIAIGGIMFENQKAIEIGTNVQIKINLLEQIPLILFGTVVRVETVSTNLFGIGVALKLERMPDNIKNEISQLLLSVKNGCVTK